MEDEVGAWLDEHPLGVVIVDVLAKVRTSGKAGLNAYDEDYAAITGLHTAARLHPGSAVLLITHDRKAGSDDWMTRITGTRGVTGAADFVIFISRKRTEMIGTVFVTGRDIEDRAHDVEFTGSGWRLAGICPGDRSQPKKVGRALGDRIAAHEAPPDSALSIASAGDRRSSGGDARVAVGGTLMVVWPKVSRDDHERHARAQAGPLPRSASARGTEWTASPPRGACRGTCDSPTSRGADAQRRP